MCVFLLLLVVGCYSFCLFVSLFVVFFVFFFVFFFLGGGGLVSYI